MVTDTIDADAEPGTRRRRVPESSAVTLLTVPCAGPADVAGLDVLTSRGHLGKDVVAVIGKTEGNGCVNDFSRSLAALAWEPLLP
ncbi:MAG: cyanuric acid amidohydrolase, partial [Pseudonocardiales bacterium]|nr:cyanuric acid amidohydrolase [Pseudonocardiales bacterium]